MPLRSAVRVYAGLNPFDLNIDDRERGRRATNLLVTIIAAAKGAASVKEPVCADGINCFVAGTLVRMADGTTKRIEDVREGDEVESRDPATGRTESERVTKTLRHRASSLVTLTLTGADSGASETIACTPEHPFNVPGDGFVAAGDLAVGDAEVYNPTVADDHTYFVGLAGGGACVHHGVYQPDGGDMTG